MSRVEALRALGSRKLLIAISLSAVSLIVACLLFGDRYMQWVVASGHGIRTDDVALDYAKGFAWSVALGLSILAWPVPWNHKRILVAAWAVKVFVALVVMLPYEAHYGRNLDGLGYYRHVFFPETQWRGLHIGDGTQNIIQIAWLHDQVFPTSYHAMKISFAMLGFIGIYCIYRAGAAFLRRDALGYLVLLSLFPSIVFWSSIIGKDTIALFLVGASTMGIAFWARGRGWGWLVFAVGAAMSLLYFRFWLMPMLLVPLGVFVLHRALRIERPTVRFATLACMFLLGVAVVIAGFRAIDVTTPQGAVEKINEVSRGFIGDDSSWHQSEFSSVGDLLRFFPMGAFTALFRPLPWEIVTPRTFAIPLQIENTLLLALFVAAIWGARRRSWRDPLLVWGLLFIAAWTCVYAFLSYNFGSLARFKLQVLPFFLGLGAYLAISPKVLPGPSTTTSSGSVSTPVQRARLLFVVNDGAYFLSHRLPLARAARDAGYDVHVAFPPHEAKRGVEAERLTYHPVPITRRGTEPLREAASIVHLARLYRRVRPDIVHHLTIKPILYGGVAARAAGVPAVVHAVTGLGHVFVATGARARVMRRIVVLGYRVAFGHPRCHALFQNPDDADRLQRERIVTAERSTVIRGSGVDMTAFTPVSEPPGPPIVVLASRLIRPKGVSDFVEAARILRRRGSPARLVIVGDTDPGNPEAIPREDLEAWAKEGAVEWWGFRPDMAALFAQTHIACLPSYYGEGVPKVLIEAAACGRPIVTTDTPGCREIARDGKNGILVPPRDPDVLADAIHRLATDAELRRVMGAHGRALAEREFSLASVNAATLALYADLRARQMD